MKIPFIDLKTQFNAIEEEIRERINVVLDHGQYIMGPEVKELEEKLCEFTGSKNCITVSSGTDALLISLMAIGIKPGDEVITTPFTFVSTAEVIVLLGAIPVWVDIDPKTCNIDASKIEEVITANTKAIMPVSLYGQVSDMNEINKIAEDNGNIPVIEDAAQSFGAMYEGKKSCNLSTIGCTSFFPAKPLGCYGDGGAIFTNDDNLAQICREIRIHGQGKRYIYNRVGVGGRMDTIQAAILLAKLDRFNWEIDKRQEIAKRYDDLINTSPNKTKVDKIIIKPDRTSVFAQYTLLVKNRDEVQLKLEKAQIPTASYYPIPLNEQEPYKHLCCGDCTPQSQKISKEVISIPFSPDISAEDQKLIIKKLLE
jgi:UDP-2-acetamido-2-deoxy-ribo-hexuluronate aminotransferase